MATQGYAATLNGGGTKTPRFGGVPLARYCSNGIELVPPYLTVGNYAWTMTVVSA